MATNSPVIGGLRFSHCLHGGNPTITRCYVDSGNGTALFLGDVVKFADTGATGTHTILGGTPSAMNVIQAAAGNTPAGVICAIDQVTGIAPGSVNLYRKYRPASVGMYLDVITDPMAVFIAQGDDVGTTLNATHVNLNCDVVVGSGSTVTGISGMFLDSSTVDTTSTLVVRILGMVDEPVNYVADGDLYKKFYVMFNVHSFKSVGVAGI